MMAKKRGTKEKGYSFWDCMRLQKIAQGGDSLKINSVFMVLLVGAVMHFCLLNGGSFMMLSCYFYIAFSVQMERSIAHSRENIFRIVPIPSQKQVKLRWMRMVVGVVQYLMICIVVETVIQHVLYGTSVVAVLFSDRYIWLKTEICLEVIYGVLYMLFLSMCLMPVTCLKKKQAIGYGILTLSGYGLLTLALMHFCKDMHHNYCLIRINFLDMEFDMSDLGFIPLRFALWIIFSSIWAIASYAACCLLEKKIGANDATEKMKSAKFQKKIPKGALLGSANLDFRPGTSFLVMLIWAVMLVFAIAGRHETWLILLLIMIAYLLVVIGFIAAYFKNRKNILHRIPASTGRLIKIALKYICVMAGAMIAGFALVSTIVMGISSGTEGLLEVWRIIANSVPKIIGAGCWLLCLFWLAVPYTFAGDKKAHTMVFTNFALGLLGVTVLMSLPFWSTGGKRLIMLLPAYLLLPLVFFVRGWWLYLKETHFARLPAKIKGLIGIIIGVLVVYVCVCMLKDGGIYDTILFVDDSAPVWDLLTLASMGGIHFWMMAVIGILCVAATVIFSIQEMKWFLAPNSRHKKV